jgi:hypothetical protein
MPVAECVLLAQKGLNCKKADVLSRRSLPPSDVRVLFTYINDDGSVVLPDPSMCKLMDVVHVADSHLFRSSMMAVFSGKTIETIPNSTVWMQTLEILAAVAYEKEDGVMVERAGGSPLRNVTAASDM